DRKGVEKEQRKPLHFKGSIYSTGLYPKFSLSIGGEFHTSVTIQEEIGLRSKVLMTKSVLNIKAKLQLMMEDAIKDRLLRQISRKEQATNMNFAKLELALILVY
ncbi:hypothetical protein Tco_1167731, partial [Tanacetum coccineum]